MSQLMVCDPFSSPMYPVSWIDMDLRYVKVLDLALKPQAMA